MKPLTPHQAVNGVVINPEVGEFTHSFADPKFEELYAAMEAQTREMVDDIWQRHLAAAKPLEESLKRMDCAGVSLDNYHWRETFERLCALRQSTVRLIEQIQKPLLDLAMLRQTATRQPARVQS